MSDEWHLDLFIAYAGLLLSVMLAVYLTLIDARWILIVSCLAAATAFLAWIRVKGKAFLEPFKRDPPHHLCKVLLLAFMIATTSTVILLVYNPLQYTRPTAYFMIVSIQSGIVAIQVMNTRMTRRGISSILFQIMLIGISLELSQSLLFPSVIGVDAWAHQEFTNEIITLGAIPSGWVYSSLPVFHIEICTTSLITTFDYKIASICSVSMVQVVSNTLIVFLLGRRLLGEREGLLAGLFLMVGNYHLQMGFWIVPNTLGVVMIILALYLVMAGYQHRTTTRVVTAAIVLFALVLTHSLSSFAIVIALSAGWIAFESYGVISHRYSPNIISLRMAAIITISMVGLWSLATPILFSRTIHLIIGGFDVELFTSAPDEVLGYAATGVPLVEQLCNNSGFLAFFAVSLIGCLYMISRKGTSITYTFAIIGLVTLAISFVGLVVGKSVLENRWWYLAQVFLCIPLSASVFLLAGLARTSLRKTAFMLIGVSLIAFFMIISPVANIDNRTLSPNSGVRYALTESEIASAEYWSQIAIDEIGSDQYYAATQQTIGLNFVPLNEELLHGDFDETGNHIILIREEVASNPFILSSGLWRLTYDPFERLDDYHYSRVFDCSSVTGWCMTSD